ncbi:MAG: UDP-N-acetylmuramoyl-L-alanyl-D-glutamate--2,6-diaminopimelate ligase [Deltaproteobacteria bacterium]|nr:UDP-N-acetylmuramoyl-L-alanyl-D-glutamate--2,6-diaminopimelate ligase [Deltaproteobacteria bacterium]
MELGRLIQGLKGAELLRGDLHRKVDGVAYDSRNIRPGYLFVAVKGHTQDGHAFLQEAADRGAGVLVAETFPEIGGDAAMIRVPDTREAMTHIGARFFDEPYRAMEIVGITGTNGKTSTTYLLESILRAAGTRPGVIGTINYRYGKTSRPAPVTTPESLDLMAVLREMADHGVTHAVMEVSSHALEQGRVRGCPMRVVVFTNLSRDHLDYHSGMDSYFMAKSILFRPREGGGVPGEGAAVINLDDPRGAELVSLSGRPVRTYGLQQRCDVRAEILSEDRNGLRARLRASEGEVVIQSSLIGRINLYNILAAAGAALSLGVGLDEVASGVEQVRSIPGRLERVENERGLSILVDYAHTPDALQKALETVRPLVDGRLITVFGCGGDRDRGKRPEMGRIGGRLSDLVVVTSDNPRTENPLEIIAQVEDGVRASGLPRLRNGTTDPGGREGYAVEPDRRKAIRLAVAAATRKDMVLIAGKGHEDYQVLGTERVHFDDREEAAIAAEVSSG